MGEYQQKSQAQKTATAEHSLPFALAQDKRRRAEQLVLTLGRSISETAAELDLSESVLRGWLQSRSFRTLRAHQGGPSQAPSRASTERAERQDAQRRAQRADAYRTVFPHLTPDASAQTAPPSRTSFAQK